MNPQNPKQPLTILAACADPRLRGALHEAGRPLGNLRQAADFASLRERLQSPRPDLLLLDFDLPGLEGPEGLRQIHAQHPDIRILLVTDEVEPKTLVAMLKAGARGYCLRDASSRLFRKAARAVLGGELWIERALVNSLIAELSSPDDCGRRRRTETARPDLAQLTSREREIAGLVARGLTHKAIASKLGISTNTIRNHLRHIFDKLGICDRLQLALIAGGHDSPAG